MFRLNARIGFHLRDDRPQEEFVEFIGFYQSLAKAKRAMTVEVLFLAGLAAQRHLSVQGLKRTYQDRFEIVRYADADMEISHSPADEFKVMVQQATIGAQIVYRGHPGE